MMGPGNVTSDGGPSGLDRNSAGEHSLRGNSLEIGTSPFSSTDTLDRLLDNDEKKEDSVNKDAQREGQRRCTRYMSIDERRI